MALTSKITTTLEHPTEAGVTVTIRKLSHHQLMMAEDAKIDRVIDKAKRMDGLNIGADRTPEEIAQGKLDAELPENKYDREVVLRSGVTAWTYDGALPDAVDDLDEDTAKWLLDEILAFSLRSAAEGKASANGSRPSTDPAVVVGQPS